MILSLKDKSEVGPFYPQVQLADGICFTPFWIYSTTCEEDSFGGDFKYCGTFAVDLNCQKGPNVEGRDIFHFFVTRDRILPTGHREQETSGGKKEFNFTEYCATLGKEYAGRGCTAWVIYNENMDYLRCGNKLSWNGRHKCHY